MNIREEIINIKDTIINWRRDFHRYPELAFKEHRTGEIIIKELRSMGLDPKENVGKTGITADLKFGGWTGYWPQGRYGCFTHKRDQWPRFFFKE